MSAAGDALALALSRRRNVEDSPAWSELTQLQRMKFGTEIEYLEHCIKWEADPAYRESNPYIA